VIDLSVAARRGLEANRKPSMRCFAGIVGCMLALSFSASLCFAEASLSQADAALQAGRADEARGILDAMVNAAPGNAEAYNLLGRVEFTLQHWENAVNDCQKAVNLKPEDARYHLWLGRALGERAGHASFLNAFTLARRSRAEFATAARLAPKDAEALTDLAEFDREAPSVIGGGLGKAEEIARQLDQIDPPRAHDLRAQMAEKEHDPSRAEGDLKAAFHGARHPAFQWIALAKFYLHQQRWSDMEEALNHAASAAEHDPRAAVTLYDGASILARTNRNLPMSIRWMEKYVASPDKTEEGPAFEALVRLSHWYHQTGNQAAAERDRAAALALAHDYKPALEPWK